MRTLNESCLVVLEDLGMQILDPYAARNALASFIYELNYKTL